MSARLPKATEANTNTNMTRKIFKISNLKFNTTKISHRQSEEEGRIRTEPEERLHHRTGRIDAAHHALPYVGEAGGMSLPHASYVGYIPIKINAFEQRGEQAGIHVGERGRIMDDYLRHIEEKMLEERFAAVCGLDGSEMHPRPIAVGRHLQLPRPQSFQSGRPAYHGDRENHSAGKVRGHESAGEVAWRHSCAPGLIGLHPRQ